MTMIEVKTADLIGPALDWAVAVVEYPGCLNRAGIGDFWRVTGMDEDGDKYLVGKIYALGAWENGVQARRYEPSTDWSQCGPLIEKYRLVVAHAGCYGWFACLQENPRCTYVDTQAEDEICGPTALVATCRAIVASKLGGTVRVPKELMP